jgi:hypothetical protein
VAQQQIAATLRPGMVPSGPPADQLPVHERWVPEQLVLTEQRHVYLGQLSWAREATARLVAQADICDIAMPFSGLPAPRQHFDQSQ